MNSSSLQPPRNEIQGNESPTTEASDNPAHENPITLQRESHGNNQTTHILSAR